MSEQQLQQFFNDQLREVQEHSLDVADFTKNHQLPLARIKKIMKSDEDVRMISAEAPVLFAKACEIFILELTLKAWRHAEENKRRTLQRNDVSAAIARTDIFDFLLDVVPKEDLTGGPEGGQGAGSSNPMPQGAPQQPMGPSMGQPGMAGMAPGGGGMMPQGMFPFPFSMPPGSEALLQGMQMPPMNPGGMQAMPGMQQMQGMGPGSSQPTQQQQGSMPQQQQATGGMDAMQGWQMPNMPPQGGMQMPQGAMDGMPQGGMQMPQGGMDSMQQGMQQGMQMVQGMAQGMDGMSQGGMAMDPAAIMSFMAGLSQQGQFPFFPPTTSGGPPGK
uniref:Transcription factor CBF/NF-Y/archaeal histone domain-containing protein n=1 Tax=Dunaliella tertiolecta TaxID=3047 RepID=A0A7S3R9X5_DUNTE|mmetsp:Transcript_6756/g.18109  ORF Transcript_6756/g.18109 Transcript_6756/m.18109 type:complete len:330 (-) Transcript_6756:533-1522(-)|eukprot:CAMPEP_0202410930 /NCGR_PEP_ID=MMETSP1128-20130828/20282_1 /ASSEMBLY_ACC=CAM_ASM_000463 /TAXON_ID=3047 /ORGANISM="Dunaliella tertiolecta, Strain CCMP1320" /LENGTH=329 /DNA_ID=CAMNT_0049016525 /DNA_START=21 /DNA_END=1010 /DNA_ORIENTATION=-